MRHAQPRARRADVGGVDGHDAEDARLQEPDQELDAIATVVVDAALEVHRLLGPGLPESVYERALAVELGLRGVCFVQQVPIGVTYKGVTIGEARLDLLVADRLVVELKACAALLPAHLAQVLSYLRTSGHPLALLINFNALHLRQGIKRVFRTQQLPLAFFVRSLVGGGP